MKFESRIRREPVPNTLIRQMFDSEASNINHKSRASQLSRVFITHIVIVILIYSAYGVNSWYAFSKYIERMKTYSMVKLYI